MKDRQIKSIKQHVAFRFFGSDLTVEAIKHKVTMTFHPMGVHVLSTKGEDVVVPYSNITHIELQPEAAKPELKPALSTISLGSPAGGGGTTTSAVGPDLPSSTNNSVAHALSVEVVQSDQPKPKAKKKIKAE